MFHCVMQVHSVPGSGRVLTNVQNSLVYGAALAVCHAGITQLVRGPFLCPSTAWPLLSDLLFVNKSGQT